MTKGTGTLEGVGEQTEMSWGCTLGLDLEDCGAGDGRGQGKNCIISLSTHVRGWLAAEVVVLSLKAEFRPMGETFVADGSGVLGCHEKKHFRGPTREDEVWW